MKEIYFIVQNLKAGSTLLRAYQIRDELLKYNKQQIIVIDINIISQLKNKENSILIWIGPIGHKYINTLSKTNINILDIVDKYLYNKLEVEESLNNNIYQNVIVNNNYMKIYFQKNTRFDGKIYVIYHHWDPRLSLTSTEIKDKLVFGYMGSIKSLLHTDNFLYYDILIKQYNIIFFDTELGIDVTQNVINNNLNYPIKYNADNIPKILWYNCDINIRDPSSDISKFKTTAKIATAVALGHNIITTLDEAVMDILPLDYPFILENSDYTTVNNMFLLVTKDYYTDKILWNKGLAILKKIKNILDIKTIINNYINLLNM